MMKNAHCVPDEVLQYIPKEEKKQSSKGPVNSISYPNFRKAVNALLSPDSKAAIKMRDKLRDALSKQELSRRVKKKNSFLKKKAVTLGIPSNRKVVNTLDELGVLRISNKGKILL